RAFPRIRSGFVWLFLALRLSLRRRTIATLRLLLIMRRHLLMMRGQLLMMLHLLIHRMLSVSRATMFGHLAGVRFRLVTSQVFSVALISGLTFVSFCCGFSCSLTITVSYVPCFVFTLSRSGPCCARCGSHSFCAFALPVGLIK